MARSSWGAEAIGYSYPSQLDRMRKERGIDTSSFLRKAREWLDLAKKKKRIRVTKDPCPCTKNHYAIDIGTVVCPIRFWLGAAALMGTDQDAKAFVDKHEFSELVKRVDKDLDACHDPGLDWKREAE